jgi:anti-sigma factor RsiW
MMPSATMFSPQPTSPYSPQDDELLSAYLDGRLSPAEAARLEARLAADPELRRRLHELRRVVQLLAQAPRLAVPRAFVLSEAQVATASPARGWQRWRRGFPRGLTLATAVVALALVFTLGVDVWSQRQSRLMVSLAPAAQPETLVAAPTTSPEAPGATSAAEAMTATATEAPSEAIVTLKAMTTTSEPATVEEPGERARMAVEATPTGEAERMATAQAETAAPTVPGSWLRALEVILTAALVALVLAMGLRRRRRATP